MSRWFTQYGFAEVHEGLFVGAYPLDESDVAELHALGIVRILNLVEDQEYPPTARAAIEPALAAAGIEEHRMNLTDFGRLPADRLETAVGIVVPWLREGQRSYLHCRAGWQRSAAVAAGAVAIVDGLDIDTALALIQQRKPSADPLPHQREDLRAWWERRWHSTRG
jgi:protein-tyrosine phosphatase